MADTDQPEAIAEPVAEDAVVEALPEPRDETAFSLDPFTGAPSASGASHRAANEAMIALGKGEIDEGEYARRVTAED